MLRGGRGSSTAQSGNREDHASLDKVLSTPELKLDLVVTVMLCMDLMRKNIVDVFDPTVTTAAPPLPPRPSAWADAADMDEKPPSYNQATSRLNNDDYIRRRSELRDPQIQELQKSLLQAFGKWRVQVLKRMGEVLKVRPESARNEKAKREAMHGFDGLIDVDYDEEDVTVSRHQGVKTSLSTFSESNRVLLLNSLLLLFLSLEHYSSYSRLLLLRMAASLKISPHILNEKEDAIAHGLLKGARQQMSAEDAKRRDNNENATGKAWKIGLATVAGAAVIGLTGGLAAPLLAGAVGSVLGGIGLGGTAIAGLLGGLAGNFVLVGGLFGAYGGSMTGKMMEKYAKEVEDFEFIPLRRVDDEGHRLRVAIGVTGWLNEDKDVYSPWLVLGDEIEGFVLQWEVEILKKLGRSLMETFKQLLVKGAAIEIIKRTVFAGLLVTLWPLGLLTLGKALSNSFSVSQARADRAGEVLADALIHKAQGERPVTLIGYSLGSRVIYSCLHTLAKRKAFGLIESAIFIGSPVSAESANWRAVRAVVADRVVNVYSRNDYVLGLVYRTSSITPDIAGLQPVEEVAGIENFDVSNLVSGHLRYQFLVGQMLERIGYEAIDSALVSKEKESLAKLDAQERQMKKEAEMKKANKTQDSKQSTEWEDILEDGTTDAATLDDEEMTRRLKDLKLKEENMREKSEPTTTASDATELTHQESMHQDTTHKGRDDSDDDDEFRGHRITMIDEDTA